MKIWNNQILLQLSHLCQVILSEQPTVGVLFTCSNALVPVPRWHCLELIATASTSGKYALASAQSLQILKSVGDLPSCVVIQEIYKVQY